MAADEGDVVKRVQAVTEERGARLVFDSVAGPGLAEIAQAVSRGGILIVYGWLDPRPAPLPMNWPLNIYGFGLNVITDDPAALRRGQAFIHAGLRSGALAPIIDRTFDLTDIVAAHRHMESNGQVGKIVVTVRH